MNSSDDSTLVAERLPKMQIIQGAIVAGALIYALVAFVIRQNGIMKGRAEQPILSYVMSAFALMALIQFPILTRRIAKENRRKIATGLPLTGSTQPQGISDTALLLASFQTQMIVGAAIVEGATFGLIVAYLFDATSWTLIGAIVLSAVNALQLPTRSRLERWLDEQRELIQQERAGVD
jgi:hypothetical protein